MPDKRTNATHAATPATREPGLEAEQPTAAATTRTKTPPARPQPRGPGAQPSKTVPANRTSNILFCVGGLLLGFALGFYLANRMIGEPLAQTAAVGVPREANGTAPPLDPAQTTGELPPGHPTINGTNGAADASSPAATSADAQQAMAVADAKPKDFALQMNAAAVFYKANDFDKAQLYLQRALDIKPKDVDALTAMGNTKYDKGDFADAATYYQRVIAVQPTNTEVQTDLGNSYFRRTPPDYARAIIEYRKTLAIDPKHEKALQNLAAAAVQLNDKATARTAIAQLAGVNPNNPMLDSLRENVNALP